MSAIGSLPREVVIDACVVGAWSFSEDDTAAAQKVRSLVYGRRLTGCVPELFWAELQEVCRKKRLLVGISSSDAETAYAMAGTSPLVEIPRVLEDLRADAWYWVTTLNLGSYDAHYLSLALALGLDVWTFDRGKFRDRTLGDPRTAGRVKVPGEDVLL